MVDLGRKLELNRIYSNSWNTFSKSLLLFDLLKKEDFLIFVETEKKALSYKKILSFLWERCFLMQNFCDLVDFFLNWNWKFFLNKDIFYIDFSVNFFEKNIFQIKKWDRVDMLSFAKKLNDLGISFAEYEEKLHFNIKWEIFTYFTNSWNVLKISFWWDEVDEILLDNKKIDFYFFLIK